MARNDNDNFNNNRQNVNVQQPSNRFGMASRFRGTPIPMKTYRHLFQTLCSYDNLLLAFQKAKQGKSNKPYVIEFEQDLQNNLYKLQWELLTKTYQPKPLTSFTIRDPKTRKISASHFRDRVIHHALINVISPIFEGRFIHDSYANRKGKGTSAALERFDHFLQKVSGNGKLISREREFQYQSHHWLCPQSRHQGLFPVGGPWRAALHHPTPYT